jgi:hypothetical protein
VPRPVAVPAAIEAGCETGCETPPENANALAISPVVSAAAVSKTMMILRPISWLRGRAIERQLSRCCPAHAAIAVRMSTVPTCQTRTVEHRQQIVSRIESLGVDQVEQSRRAASYEERILKGENLDNLPMQAPTKFELNLKTAHRGRIGCSRSQRDDRMTRREFVTWLPLRPHNAHTRARARATVARLHSRAEEFFRKPLSNVIFELHECARF